MTKGRCNSGLINMKRTPALELWEEIEQTRDKFTNADCVEEAEKYYKRLKKLKKMYNACVTDEMHKEVINTIELRTRGF